MLPRRIRYAPNLLGKEAASRFFLYYRTWMLGVNRLGASAWRWVETALTVTARLQTLPAFSVVGGESQQVEDAVDTLIHNVVDGLGFGVKGGQRRCNDGAHFG